jgi:hypothetical protein
MDHRGRLIVQAAKGEKRFRGFCGNCLIRLCIHAISPERESKGNGRSRRIGIPSGRYQRIPAPLREESCSREEVSSSSGIIRQNRFPLAACAMRRPR